MSKKIAAKEKNGKEWWIITPNIGVYSFAKNPKQVTFLEIFYLFAQDLVNTSTTIAKENEHKIRETKIRILLHLDNRVQQLLFFLNETKKQEVRILKIKPKQKIRSYKPEQIFLSYLTAYSDALHSIRDEVLAIDKLMGKNYSNKIWQKEWFKIDIDIRTLLHHIESPLFSREGDRFNFRFERIQQMDKKKTKFLRNPNQTHAEFLLDLKNSSKDIIKELNIWAEKYLNLLNEDTAKDSIIGYYKDGRIKTRKIILKNLKKIAQRNI